MDKDKIISFQKALDHTKTTTRSILLGNGFSRSISPRFSYEDLLKLTNNIEKMQQHQLPAELRHLFQGLDTVDFEKVIAHLEIAQIVLYSYSKNDGGENTCSELEQKINSDKESAKTTFVHAINYTHDNLARNILPETFSLIGDFLYNFSSIFTLNYDLLLYWILMKKKEKVGINNFKFDDGFTRSGWGIIERCIVNQNTFYLHGALHLFHTDELFKITCDEDESLTRKMVLSQKYFCDRTSNDNPFSESHFKTLKYRPEFPVRFQSLQHGEAFCQQFFSWYNKEHYHSGIAWLTPESVHYHQEQAILEQRHKVLMQAFLDNPGRFNNKQPQLKKLPNAVYINPPHVIGIQNNSGQIEVSMAR